MGEIFMNPVKIWQVFTQYFVSQKACFVKNISQKPVLGYPFLK